MANRYRKRHTRTNTPSSTKTTTTTTTTNKLAWSSRRPSPARIFQEATRTTPRTTKTMASAMRPQHRLCSNDNRVEKRNDQDDRERNQGVLTNNITSVSSPEPKCTVLRSCYRLKLEYHDDRNNNDDNSNNVSVEDHLQRLQLVDKDDTNSDSSRTTSLSFTSSSSASSSNQNTTQRGRNPTLSSPWRRPKRNKNNNNTKKAYRGRTPQSAAPVMNLRLRTAIEASRIFQGLVVGKNGTILQQNSRANRRRLGTTIEAGQSRQAMEIEQILATCTCTTTGTARTTSSNQNGARNDIEVEYNRKYTGTTPPMVASGVTETTKNTNHTTATNTNHRRGDEILLVKRQYDTMQQLIEEGLRRNHTTRTRFVRNADALLRVL